MDLLLLTTLWAKLPPAEKPDVHPLLCHLLDTGSVIAGLWETSLHEGLRSWLAGAFGLDVESAGRWIAFWAALHDLGKATPAFQKKAERTHPEIVRALGSGRVSWRRRISWEAKGWVPYLMDQEELQVAGKVNDDLQPA